MIVEKGLRIVRAQCKNPDRESAVSSGVEHHIDIVGVTGSNPVSRTIDLKFTVLIPQRGIVMDQVPDFLN